MSTDAPFTPPKKKPNVLWWLGGGFGLLVFLFFLQLFGLNPPIVVSQQTTYITGPLGRDGLPDYERYILERSRKDVTPDNSAAALLWPPLWPGEAKKRCQEPFLDRRLSFGYGPRPWGDQGERLKAGSFIMS